MVAIKLGMWAEAHAQNDCHPQGNPLPPLGKGWGGKYLVTNGVA